MTAPRARRGPVTRAVASALRTIPRTAKADAGAIALARRYAELIDDAAPAARYRAHLDGLIECVDLLEQLDAKRGADARAHLIKVAAALSAHTVASDLGPKLLAVLAQLGLTPAGRGVKGAASVGAKPASKADELRKRREDRARRAAESGAGVD